MSKWCRDPQVSLKGRGLRVEMLVMPRNGLGITIIGVVPWETLAELGAADLIVEAEGRLQHVERDDLDQGVLF